MTDTAHGKRATGKHIQFGEDAKKPRTCEQLNYGIQNREEDREIHLEHLARQNKSDAIDEARTALKHTQSVLLGSEDSPRKEKINYTGNPKKLQLEEKKKLANDKHKASQQDEGEDPGFLSNYDRRNLDSMYRTSTGVPRFDAYLSQQQEKLRRLKLDQDRRVAAELRDKPQITKHPGMNDPNRVPIYKRNPQMFEDSKVKTMEDAILKREMEEFRNCTFKPDTSKSRSRNKSKRPVDQDDDFSPNQDQREPTKTVNELINWKAERDARVAMLRMGHVDGKDEQCTFQPTLNSRSIQLAQNRERTHLALPIKHSRETFIKEFLEKEKQDMFKPKINSNAGEIRDGGYKLGQGVPIKMPPKRFKKEASPPKSAKSARKYKPTMHERLRPDLDEDEIKDRYRIEANPDIMNGKGLSAQLRKHIEQRQGSLTRSRSINSARTLARKSQMGERSKSSRRSEGSLSRSAKSNKGLLQKLVQKSGKQRQRKLFQDKSSRYGSPRSRSHHSQSEQALAISGGRRVLDEEIERIMARAERENRKDGGRSDSLMSRKKAESKSRSRGRRRESSGKRGSPSQKKSVAFAESWGSEGRGERVDSQQWRSIVQEQYELSTRRRVDALIYKDEQETGLKTGGPSASKKVANAFKHLSLKH